MARELFLGPLQPFLRDGPMIEVSTGTPAECDPDGEAAVVLAHEVLQDLPDYRSALQTWFAACEAHGRLIVTVPHAFLHDRQATLALRRRPQQRRLYTPASLMNEVEEALSPNTYRVRHLADADLGYDYALSPDQVPAGQHHVVLVLEKIAPPAWTVLQPTSSPLSTRDVPEFEPPHTRLELTALAPRTRILALKLDHLGDFIMGLPGLERLRQAFPTSHITLVVGSWNADLARSIGVADAVEIFDVFPRNSSEDPVDVVGKTALFQSLIVDDYDLAIDLRTDPDTRFLLTSVRAGLRAGMGTRSRFPFLDIFLPVDFTRDEPERARQDLLDHHGFASKSELRRTPFRIACVGRDTPRDNALIWGPYWSLQPGNYIFEPFLEIEEGENAALMLDVALDTQRVRGVVTQTGERLQLPFTVLDAGSQFESRIWSVEGAPIPNFGFHGGRLIRQGAASVLHQSEYIELLVELVRLRVAETGVLFEAGRF